VTHGVLLKTSRWVIHHSLAAVKRRPGKSAKRMETKTPDIGRGRVGYKSYGKGGKGGRGQRGPPPARLEPTCEIHGTLPSEISKTQEVMIEGGKNSWPQVVY
jgi:hypothetical protein